MSYLSEEQFVAKSDFNLYLPQPDMAMDTSCHSQDSGKEKVLLSTISNIYADLEKTDEDIQLMNQNLYEYIDKMISVQKNFDNVDSVKLEEFNQRSTNVSCGANVLPYPTSNASSNDFSACAVDNSAALGISRDDNRTLNEYDGFATSPRTEAVDIQLPSCSRQYDVPLCNEFMSTVPNSTEKRCSFSENNNSSQSDVSGQDHCRQILNDPRLLYSDYCQSATNNRFNESQDRNFTFLASLIKLPPSQSDSTRPSNEHSFSEELASSYSPFAQRDVPFSFVTDDIGVGYKVPFKEVSAVCQEPAYRSDSSEGNKKRVRFDDVVHSSDSSAQDAPRNREESEDDDFECGPPSERHDDAEQSDQANETQTFTDHESGWAIMNLDDSCQVHVHQQQYYQNYYKKSKARSLSGVGVKNTELSANRDQDSICKNILERYDQYKKNIVSEIPKVDNQSSSSGPGETPTKESSGNSDVHTLTYGEYKRWRTANSNSITDTRKNMAVDQMAGNLDLNKDRSDLRIQDLSKSQRVTSSSSQINNRTKVERDSNNLLKNNNVYKKFKSNGTKVNLNQESYRTKPNKQRNVADKGPPKWDPLKSKYGRKPSIDDSRTAGEVSFNPFSPFCPDDRVDKMKPLRNMATPERDPESRLAEILGLRDKGKDKDSKTKRFDPAKMSDFKKKKGVSKNDSKKHKQHTKREDWTVSEPVTSSTNDLVVSSGDDVPEGSSSRTRTSISTEPDDSTCEPVTSSTITLTECADQNENDTANFDSKTAVKVFPISDDSTNEMPEKCLARTNAQNTVGVLVSNPEPQILESASEKFESVEKENENATNQTTTEEGLQDDYAEHSDDVLVSNSVPEKVVASIEKLESVDNQSLKEDFKSVGDGNGIPCVKQISVSDTTCQIPNQVSEEIESKGEESQNMVLPSSVSDMSQQTGIVHTDESRNENQKGLTNIVSSNDIIENVVGNDYDGTIENMQINIVKNIDSRTADVCEPEKGTTGERMTDIDIQRICKYRVCKLVLLDIFWKAKRDGKFKKSRLNRLTRKFMKKYNYKLNKAKLLLKNIKDTNELTLGSSQKKLSGGPDGEPLSVSNDPVEVVPDDDDDDDKSIKLSGSKKVNVMSDSEDEGTAEGTSKETPKMAIYDCKERSDVCSPSEVSCAKDGSDEKKSNKEIPNVSTSDHSDNDDLNNCENEPILLVACTEESTVQKALEATSEELRSPVCEEVQGDQIDTGPCVDKYLPESLDRMPSTNKAIEGNDNPNDIDSIDKPLTKIKIQRVRDTSVATKDRYIFMKPGGLTGSFKATKDAKVRHAKSRDIKLKEKRKTHSSRREKDDVERKPKGHRKNKQTIFEDDSAETEKQTPEIATKGVLVEDDVFSKKIKSSKADKTRCKEEIPSKSIDRKKKKHKTRNVERVRSREKDSTGDSENLDVHRALEDEKTRPSNDPATGLELVDGTSSNDQADKSELAATSNEQTMLYNFICEFDKNMDCAATSDTPDPCVTTCGVPLDGPALSSVGPLPVIDNVMSEIDKSLLEMAKMSNTVIDDSSDSGNEDVPFLKNLDSILTDLGVMGADDNAVGFGNDENIATGCGENILDTYNTDSSNYLNLKIVDVHSIADINDIDRKSDEITDDPDKFAQDCKTKVKTKAELKQTFDGVLSSPEKNTRKTKKEGNKREAKHMKSKICGLSSATSSRPETKVEPDNSFMCICCQKRYGTPRTDPPNQGISLFCQGCFIKAYKVRFMKYKKKFNSIVKKEHADQK